ncbi:hypothetical protein FOA52_005544 [Chlamydomonas sp. UWO 241]|nr:hypothetical protein FOA52_005544 [Chlamydomonas sp. UWO 241]
MEHFQESPLLGGKPRERDILAFFKGDMGTNRLAHHSRGLRQRILKKVTEDGWGDKYRVRVGTADDASMPGSYSKGLARSVFCLVLPGDGWSSRAEDAASHGCIPVVIMDRVHAVHESILDWDMFSVRVAESEVESLPQILAAISDARVRRMQARLSRVAHYFVYNTGQLPNFIFRSIHAGNAGGKAPADDHPLWGDDAFATIMQWLHSRIGRARGGGPSHRNPWWNS